MSNETMNEAVGAVFVDGIADVMAGVAVASLKEGTMVWDGEGNLVEPFNEQDLLDAARDVLANWFPGKTISIGRNIHQGQRHGVSVYDGETYVDMDAEFRQRLNVAIRDLAWRLNAGVTRTAVLEALAA